MLKRIVGLVLAFPAFLLLVTLAVTNKHAVRLNLNPFRPDDSVLAIEMPFFYYLLGALIAGVLLGGLATWLTQSHWRRSARTRAQDAMRWRSEADRLARERDAGIDQNAASGLGKALAVIRR